MRSLQPHVKAVLLTKLREYKSDLNNLKNEVKRISSGNLNAAARDELLESGMADAMTVCSNSHLCYICGSKIKNVMITQVLFNCFKILFFIFGKWQFEYLFSV